jgi:hypothetical protein
MRLNVARSISAGQCPALKWKLRLFVYFSAGRVSESLTRPACTAHFDALGDRGIRFSALRAAFLAAFRADQRARNRFKTRSVMGATA